MATTQALAGGASPPLFPIVPWRDPHTVSPAELSAHIQRLEHACLANPRSADLRTCLGMAYAVNFDVYKSMDALEEATAIVSPPAAIAWSAVGTAPTVVNGRNTVSVSVSSGNRIYRLRQ